MLQAAVAATDTAMKDLAATSIPSFVLEYAPLVWLHSQDPYMPSDIGQQLVHTTPMVDHKPIQGLQSPLTLDNLDGLNSLGNTSVYLTSREGISASPQPAWFKGTAPDQQGKTNGAVSSTIIIRDHNNGTVDAFYFHESKGTTKGTPSWVWNSVTMSGTGKSSQKIISIGAQLSRNIGSTI